MTTTNQLHFDVEQDAPPVVRVLANTLKLSLQRHNSPELVDAINGVFALKSTKNTQAVTVSIKDNKISLSSSVADTAQVIFNLDLDSPDQKPSVTGVMRHPLLAYRIG